VEAGDLQGIAQELADVVYVAYGTALTYGIPLDAVLAEVHRANMSKLDADGKPLLRDDGKVLKSELYRAPDVAAVLARQETPEPDALDRLNRGLAELGMAAAVLTVATSRSLLDWPEAVVRLVHADDPEAAYGEIRIPLELGGEAALSGSKNVEESGDQR
jgi:hypothetical protein